MLRKNGCDRKASVSYKTIELDVDNAAVADIDYIPEQGTLNFDRDEDRREIVVTVPGNNIEGSNFGVVLFDPSEGMEILEGYIMVSTSMDKHDLM